MTFFIPSLRIAFALCTSTVLTLIPSCAATSWTRAAAVGLAPKLPNGDPVMWPIYTGVLIAILALQQIAPHAMNLLKKYPILEPTAFVPHVMSDDPLAPQARVVLCKSAPWQAAPRSQPRQAPA